MVVQEASINNIMGGLEQAEGVKLHTHRRKLKQRFDIIKKLGQGTYGKVQLGINKETGQEVAIKTIKKAKIETEGDLIRIRREIQIMSSLRHPYIIHIYEVFENKDKIVLVMEYACGGELYDYLCQRKVLDDAEAQRLFRQIAMAVYYCHKHQICHRDLKLENILLDEDGNAKLADFGLSNVFDSSRLLNTFCGSPLYASPEIVSGTPYYGPEVDCWSLGVLLYTLVYGAMPFDGSNFKRLVKQISHGEYYEPKTPSSASGLIRALLTVDGSERLDIVGVCSHQWLNSDDKETPCVKRALELSSEKPVRLDLLLSLNQPMSTALQPAQAAQQASPTKSSVVKSHSMGSMPTSKVPTPPVKSPVKQPEAPKDNKEESQPVGKPAENQAVVPPETPRQPSTPDAPTSKEVDKVKKKSPKKVSPEPTVVEKSAEPIPPVPPTPKKVVKKVVRKASPSVKEAVVEEPSLEVPKPSQESKQEASHSVEQIKPQDKPVEAKKILEVAEVKSTPVEDDSKEAEEPTTPPSPVTQQDFKLASTVHLDQLIRKEIGSQECLPEFDRLKKENALKVISHAISESAMSGERKSSTLPRRRLSRPEVGHQVAHPVWRSAGPGTSPIGSIAANSRNTPFAYPTPAPRTSLSKQESKEEPAAGAPGTPRERIIPIALEDRESKATSAQGPVQSSTSPAVQQTPRQPSVRAASLSRDGSDSGSSISSFSMKGEPVRKSPREVIIPIAVEGGGYVTPPLRSSLDETSSSLGAGGASSSRDTVRGFGLASTRPPKPPGLDTQDSVSSDEDDDNFEILTAENLFSTLLSRVRSLTQRLNDDTGRATVFPRLFNQDSIFDNPSWSRRRGLLSQHRLGSSSLSGDSDSMLSRASSRLTEELPSRIASDDASMSMRPGRFTSSTLPRDFLGTRSVRSLDESRTDSSSSIRSANRKPPISSRKKLLRTISDSYDDRSYLNRDRIIREGLDCDVLTARDKLRDLKDCARNVLERDRKMERDSFTDRPPLASRSRERSLDRFESSLDRIESVLEEFGRAGSLVRSRSASRPRSYTGKLQEFRNSLTDDRSLRLFDRYSPEASIKVDKEVNRDTSEELQDFMRLADKTQALIDRLQKRHVMAIKPDENQLIENTLNDLDRLSSKSCNWSSSTLSNIDSPQIYIGAGKYCKTPMNISKEYNDSMKKYDDFKCLETIQESPGKKKVKKKQVSDQNENRIESSSAETKKKSIKKKIKTNSDESTEIKQSNDVHSSINVSDKPIKSILLNGSDGNSSISNGIPLKKNISSDINKVSISVEKSADVKVSSASINSTRDDDKNQTVKKSADVNESPADDEKLRVKKSGSNNKEVSIDDGTAVKNSDKKINTVKKSAVSIDESEIKKSDGKKVILLNSVKKIIDDVKESVEDSVMRKSDDKKLFVKKSTNDMKSIPIDDLKFTSNDKIEVMSNGVEKFDDGKSPSIDSKVGRTPDDKLMTVLKSDETVTKSMNKNGSSIRCDSSVEKKITDVNSSSVTIDDGKSLKNVKKSVDDVKSLSVSTDDGKSLKNVKKSVDDVKSLSVTTDDSKSFKIVKKLIIDVESTPISNDIGITKNVKKLADDVKCAAKVNKPADVQPTLVSDDVKRLTKVNKSTDVETTPLVIDDVKNMNKLTDDIKTASESIMDGKSLTEVNKFTNDAKRITVSDNDLKSAVEESGAVVLKDDVKNKFVDLPPKSTVDYSSAAMKQPTKIIQADERKLKYNDVGVKRFDKNFSGPYAIGVLNRDAMSRMNEGTLRYFGVSQTTINDLANSSMLAKSGRCAEKPQKNSTNDVLKNGMKSAPDPPPKSESKSGVDTDLSKSTTIIKEKRDRIRQLEEELISLSDSIKKDTMKASGIEEDQQNSIVAIDSHNPNALDLSKIKIDSASVVDSIHSLVAADCKKTEQSIADCSVKTKKIADRAALSKSEVDSTVTCKVSNVEDVRKTSDAKSDVRSLNGNDVCGRESIKSDVLFENNNDDVLDNKCCEVNLESEIKSGVDVSEEPKPKGKTVKKIVKKSDESTGKTVVKKKLVKSSSEVNGEVKKKIVKVKCETVGTDSSIDNKYVDDKSTGIIVNCADAQSADNNPKEQVVKMFDKVSESMTVSETGDITVVCKLKKRNSLTKRPTDVGRKFEFNRSLSSPDGKCDSEVSPTFEKSILDKFKIGRSGDKNMSSLPPLPSKNSEQDVQKCGDNDRKSEDDSTVGNGLLVRRTSITEVSKIVKNCSSDCLQKCVKERSMSPKIPVRIRDPSVPRTDEASKSAVKKDPVTSRESSPNVEIKRRGSPKVVVRRASPKMGEVADKSNLDIKRTASPKFSYLDSLKSKWSPKKIEKTSQIKIADENHSFSLRSEEEIVKKETQSKREVSPIKREIPPLKREISPKKDFRRELSPKKDFRRELSPKKDFRKELSPKKDFKRSASPKKREITPKKEIRRDGLSPKKEISPVKRLSPVKKIVNNNAKMEVTKKSEVIVDKSKFKFPTVTREESILKKPIALRMNLSKFGVQQDDFSKRRSIKEKDFSSRSFGIEKFESINTETKSDEQRLTGGTKIARKVRSDSVKSALEKFESVSKSDTKIDATSNADVKLDKEMKEHKVEIKSKESVDSIVKIDSTRSNKTDSLASDSKSGVCDSTRVTSIVEGALDKPIVEDAFIKPNVDSASTKPNLEGVLPEPNVDSASPKLNPDGALLKPNAEDVSDKLNDAAVLKSSAKICLETSFDSKTPQVRTEDKKKKIVKTKKSLKKPDKVKEIDGDSKKGKRIEKVIKSLRRNSLGQIDFYTESHLLRRAMSMEDFQSSNSDLSYQSVAYNSDEETKKKSKAVRKGTVFDLIQSRILKGVKSDTDPNRTDDPEEASCSNSIDNSANSESCGSDLTEPTDVEDRIKRKSYYNRFNLSTSKIKSSIYKRYI